MLKYNLDGKASCMRVFVNKYPDKITKAEKTSYKLQILDDDAKDGVATLGLSAELVANLRLDIAENRKKFEGKEVSYSVSYGEYLGRGWLSVTSLNLVK